MKVFQVSINKQHNGFTVVELLIVIVVIAVLASVARVAYVGVTERAKAVDDIAVVNSYLEAFRVADGDGKTPPPSSCLGPIGAYPSGCSVMGTTAYVSTITNDLLTSYGISPANQKRMSSTSTPDLILNSGSYGSGVYGVSSLMYYLPSNQDCVVPILDPAASWTRSSAKFSSRDSTATFCATILLE